MVQFMLGIVGALVIAELYLQGGARMVFIPCVMLWLQLYTIGLLNEGRPGARRIELLRLLIAMPVLYLLALRGEVGVEAGALGWIILAVYAIGSAAWVLLLSAAFPSKVKT
jgi:hypothetical protein